MNLKNNYLQLALAFLLLASAFIINKSKILEPGPKSIISDFVNTLHHKEEKLDKEISLLIKKAASRNYENLFLDEENYYRALFDEEGLLLYIYENDSIRYWTSNFAPVEPIIDSLSFITEKLPKNVFGISGNSRLIHLKNGWYEIFRKTEGNKLFVGLLLIKTEYPIENKYLTNRFQEDFSIPSNAIVGKIQTSGGNQGALTEKIISLTDTPSAKIIQEEEIIKSFDRQELCSIKLRGNNSGSFLFRVLITLLNISGFLFLVIFLKAETKKLSLHIGNNYSVLLFVFSLAGLRMIALLLQYPQAFYEMPLFSPEFYATSFLFPSLGDFIINSLLIFYFSYFLRRHISLDFLINMKRIEKRRLFYLLLFLLFSFSVMIEFLIKGLIEDSNISFNINNLTELTGYSYAALTSIGLLMFAFFFVCDMVVLVFFKENFLLREVIPAFAISSAPFIFFLIWYDYGTLPVIWAAIIFSLIFIIYRKNKGVYAFANIVIIISVFSLLAANSLIKYVSIKELTQRKVLAEKLSIEEDPIAEILYSEIEPKLLNDVIFANLKYGLVNYDKEFFDNALREKYFSGYLSRYDVKSYLFRTDGNPVSAFNKIKYERNYFERLINQNGRPTLNENMIHIENSEENEIYIIRIPVKDRTGKDFSGIMFICLESKLQPETSGFPELLIDNKMKPARQLEDKKYSFAKYRKGRLAEHYGKYNYSLSANTYGSPEKKTSYSDADRYNHLVFRSDNNNAVILSKPKEGWVEFITTFSYLFTIFGILVLSFLNLRNFPEKFKMKNAGFNYKVQVMVVAVMFISMILFGIGTSYFIYLEYNKKNHSILSEKIHSVLIEVEHKLSSEDQLGEKLKEYISYILTKFSTVFFTDINLYDLNGNLLASSRPKLFNEGIIARQMDNKAFFETRYIQKSEFIQSEKIGELSYHSAYIPFKNKKGEVLAYLNLPYFARQDTLKDEISSFLVALINIYVFLFAFSLIAALFISNAITRPLQYVQTMLSRVELGKTNKPIEYKGKDEIGRLVKVYNTKVAELEKSAELLAKSERESAWREMAKQVAHEIKNPLTPMKLSVQHLQRALKENPGNQEEFLKRFTQTMVEQIDALSAIASEFSNFAKMPKANNEPVNLIVIIENALHLFKDTPEINFVLKTELPQAIVLADKEQLLRVFINLFQNSIQAIPKERMGLLKINIDRKIVKIPSVDGETTRAPGEENENLREQNYYGNFSNFIIRIEDNGQGIIHEQMSKIFSPNFTTKTTGMGLGLAMVKNIVESSNGKIWFETQAGTGTIFFIELQEWKENNKNKI